MEIRWHHYMVNTQNAEDQLYKICFRFSPLEAQHIGPVVRVEGTAEKGFILTPGQAGSKNNFKLNALHLDNAAAAHIMSLNGPPFGLTAREKVKAIVLDVTLMKGGAIQTKPLPRAAWLKPGERPWLRGELGARGYMPYGAWKTLRDQRAAQAQMPLPNGKPVDASAAFQHTLQVSAPPAPTPPAPILSEPAALIDEGVLGTTINAVRAINTLAEKIGGKLEIGADGKIHIVL